MKFIALLILIGLAQWYFRKPPPPVVHIVPYCVSQTQRFMGGGAVYLPCSEVDRYEYA